MPWKRLPRVALISLAVGLSVIPGSRTATWSRSTGLVPEQIPPRARLTLEHVIEHAFVSTRMEADPYVVRPEVFEFLLDHPEFATHVTRALRLARYRVWQTADGLFLDDGWGAKGHFAVIHAGAGIRAMHARGRWEQRLLPDIRGQAVVVLEYGFRPDATGRTVVATTISGHVMLDSRFLHFLATLMSPIAQDKANREAREVLKVFRKVSLAIDESPERLYDKVRERHGVPREELAEFRRLLDRRHQPAE